MLEVLLCYFEKRKTVLVFGGIIVHFVYKNNTTLLQATRVLEGGSVEGCIVCCGILI